MLNIGIKEQGIKKNSKQIDFALARPLGDKEELGRSITYGLSLVEKVVNYACEFRFEDMFENFVVDSRVIEKQIEKKKKEKERESRHEKLEPFAIIHADAGYDLRAQSDDLVPIYWEYDKYDLYGGKKAYCMLPKDFAAAVLKCDLSALISEEQFGKTERKILDELVNRKCLKKRQIAGKTYYFDLDGKTRTYLIKALRTRT